MAGRSKRGADVDAEFAVLAPNIYRLFMMLNPNMGISQLAMEAMFGFVRDIAAPLLQAAAGEAERGHRRNLVSGDVHLAVCKLLTGELAQHACNEGAKAEHRFMEAGQHAGNGRMNKSDRAGLVLPVSFFSKHLKQETGLQIDDGAAIFFTAVMEYLVGEILEGGGVRAAKAKQTRIIPGMLDHTIYYDPELHKLLPHVIPERIAKETTSPQPDRST